MSKRPTFKALKVVRRIMVSDHEHRADNMRYVRTSVLMRAFREFPFRSFLTMDNLVADGMGRIYVPGEWTDPHPDLLSRGYGLCEVNTHDWSR